MLDARKSAILRKVVTEHIETGQPVGSGHVVQDPAIEVSAATVRADMSALEREGYLTQPHTSAGRIPTDKGYRFFVDQLDEPDLPDPADETTVSEFFNRAHGALEQMLRETTGLLSRLTSSAAVVIGPVHEVLTVRDLLLTRIAPRHALFVVVLSNGVVEQHGIEIEETTADADLEMAVALLRERLIGQTLGRAREPKRTGQAGVDGCLVSCHRALTHVSSALPGNEEVYVGGTALMAEQFNAVDTVREVLTILEESFVVVSLLQDILSKGNTVSIGAEHRVESLAECSLVVAPYAVDREVVGTIGVLGPTRMNYPQALAAVALVSRRLTRELTGA